MEWGWIGEILRREHQRPGRCIACDEPLPIKPAGAAHRPRTLLCGDRECTTTYNAMWKSMKRELATLGRRDDLQQANALVRRANRELRAAVDAAQEGGAHETA